MGRRRGRASIGASVSSSVSKTYICTDMRDGGRFEMVSPRCEIAPDPDPTGAHGHPLVHIPFSPLIVFRKRFLVWGIGHRHRLSASAAIEDGSPRGWPCQHGCASTRIFAACHGVRLELQLCSKSKSPTINSCRPCQRHQCGSCNTTLRYTAVWTWTMDMRHGHGHGKGICAHM